MVSNDPTPLVTTGQHPSLILPPPMPAQSPRSYPLGVAELDCAGVGLREGDVVALQAPAERHHDSREAALEAVKRTATAIAAHAESRSVVVVVTVTAAGTAADAVQLLEQVRSAGLDESLIRDHVRLAAVTTMAELIHAVATVVAAGCTVTALVVLDYGLLAGRSTGTEHHRREPDTVRRGDAELLTLLAGGHLATAFHSEIGITAGRVGLDLGAHDQIAVLVTTRSPRPRGAAPRHTSRFTAAEATTDRHLLKVASVVYDLTLGTLKCRHLRAA